MTAMMHGSRWLPKGNISRNASSLEDDLDNRSTCSGTEPSDDERPSRTSSLSTSVSGSTGLAKHDGRKWGRQLLGLLKTGEGSKGEPPPPPPPPPLPPPKTKLHSGASLFIPKASVTQPQPWEAQGQAQPQGCSYTSANQCQSSSFDKEMFCWEYMHRGYCPRQATCRWVHPPVDNSSNWNSTFPSAAVGAFVPQSTVVQAPYTAQSVFPQACSQVAFGPKVNFIPVGSGCNFVPATLQSQIAPSSCVPDSQCYIVPQTRECRIQPQAANSSTGHAPLSLPLVDIHSRPCRQSGTSDLHDPDDETPWPQFMQDPMLMSLTPREDSRSQTPVQEIAVTAKAPPKKSWADIQEDSDVDEPYLPQWECRPSEDSNNRVQ